MSQSRCCWRSEFTKKMLQSFSNQDDDEEDNAKHGIRCPPKSYDLPVEISEIFMVGHHDASPRLAMDLHWTLRLYKMWHFNPNAFQDNNFIINHCFGGSRIIYCLQMFNCSLVNWVYVFLINCCDEETRETAHAIYLFVILFYLFNMNNLLLQ